MRALDLNNEPDRSVPADDEPSCSASGGWCGDELWELVQPLIPQCPTRRRGGDAAPADDRASGAPMPTHRWLRDRLLQRRLRLLFGCTRLRSLPGSVRRAEPCRHRSYTMGSTLPCQCRKRNSDLLSVGADVGRGDATVAAGVCVAGIGAGARAYPTHHAWDCGVPRMRPAGEIHGVVGHVQVRRVGRLDWLLARLLGS